MMCRTVSVSIPQNLRIGSPSNRPTVNRCPLTGACPVYIAGAIFSRCLPNLSRSSALFLHGLYINSLPCLRPGRSIQMLAVSHIRLPTFKFHCHNFMLMSEHSIGNFNTFGTEAQYRGVAKPVAR